MYSAVGCLDRQNTKTPAEAGVSLEGQPQGQGSQNASMTEAEIALIKILREIGPEYTRMVYFAAAQKARFLIEDGKLEVKNKLSLNKELDTLATASIK